MNSWRNKSYFVQRYLWEQFNWKSFAHIFAFDKRTWELGKKKKRNTNKYIIEPYLEKWMELNYLGKKYMHKKYV